MHSECHVPSGANDFDEKTFFGVLNLLPPYVVIDKLTLKRDKSTCTFSRILHMYYTRKCKKTIIDLSNDSLQLDAEIPGFHELPQDYFAP